MRYLNFLLLAPALIATPEAATPSRPPKRATAPSQLAWAEIHGVSLWGKLGRRALSFPSLYACP